MQPKVFSFLLTVHPAIPDIIYILRCCRHVGLRKAIHIPWYQRILQSLRQRGVKISSTYAKSRHCIEFCERHHDRSAGFIHKNVPIGYIIPHKINEGFINDEEALFFSLPNGERPRSPMEKIRQDYWDGRDRSKNAGGVSSRSPSKGSANP